MWMTLKDFYYFNMDEINEIFDAEELNKTYRDRILEALNFCFGDGILIVSEQDLKEIISYITAKVNTYDTKNDRNMRFSLKTIVRVICNQVRFYTDFNDYVRFEEDMETKKNYLLRRVIKKTV